MKKVLVLSDSHGDVDAMERAVARERPDLILHLGDLCRDFDELQRRLPITQAMQNVCGNCDGFTEVPDQRVLLVEGLHLMNPGSCRGSRGTYGVIELGEGEPLFRIEENRAGV